MTTKTAAPSKAQLSANLKAELSSVPIRLVTAWEAHDAEGFSMLFVEDGTLILPGVYVKGREEIRKYMEAEFAAKYEGTSVTGTPLDIKPLGTDAVALITVGGVLMPGENKVSTKEAIRASWILVKDDGTWRLAVYHNCPRDKAK